MSIIYRPDVKHCRRLARAAKHCRRLARAARPPIPFVTSLFYTEDEAYRIYDANDDWLTYCRWELNMDACFEDLFLPYCAWCYELRDGLSDSNEHDECDARLHYCSEIGKAEQAELLTTEIVPKAPTSVISLIMSFL
jgi:hypothetical protein